MTLNDIQKSNSLVEVLAELSNSDSNIVSLDDVTLDSVSGGDINQAHIVTTPDNKQYFLKRNELDNFALLQSEVIGLTAIADTGAQTCQPLALGQDDELGFSYLILSMIYTSQATQKHNISKENWANLAEQLVTLHQAVPPQPNSQSHSQSERHLKQKWQAGWFEDNFIGFTPQSNSWMSDWHEFFATQRLQPQIQLAFDNNYLDKTTLAQLERIQHKLESYLPNYTINDGDKDDDNVKGDGNKGATRPSLLHGDLWAGNALFGYDTLYRRGKSRGKNSYDKNSYDKNSYDKNSYDKNSYDKNSCVKNSYDNKNDNKVQGYLIDPAVYVGHPETDIAMTLLFGGFDLHFYEIYSEYLPIEPSFNERQDIYNLYHYLNHLNLFGASYFGAVKRIAKRFG